MLESHQIEKYSKLSVIRVTDIIIMATHSNTVFQIVIFNQF